MKHLKSIIYSIVFLISGPLVAQQYEFGEVSKEELAKTSYDIDTSAAAIVLHKSRNTYFEHQHPDGYVLVTEVHKRVKILKKSGLDYATDEVSLYQGKKSKERISSLKGYTHTLEGGKVKKEKLKKSGIFKNELNDNWKETSFTLPNAQVGSIVEWSYKVTSPFWKIDDLIIQEDIPVQHYFGKVQTLEYFNFQRVVKGPYQITPREYREQRNLSVSYEQSTTSALTQSTRSATIQVGENVAEYDVSNVPALKEEDYVDNINNYRFLINYELMSVQFPNRPIKRYSTSWEEVVKTITKSDNFGGQLERTRFLRDKAEEIQGSSSGEIEIMNNAYNFVKSHMTWNKKYGKYTREGIQRAYKEKTGDVAEINLMLIALLKECGIAASPVLVSTRSHGVPVFPTLEGFNYVIAHANVGGKNYLMDATDNYCVPNMLPERAMNWEGTLVLPDGNFKKIDLYPKDLSQRNSMLNVTVDADGMIEGDYSCNLTSLDAMNFRKILNSYSDEEYTEELLEDWQLDEISELQVNNRDDLGQPITIKCDFEKEEGVSFAGNDMYFSPLFFLGLDENPFKLEERAFPINYVYPLVRKRIVNIKLPEGYQISEIPKPVRMALPDGMGSYLFNISEVPGGLSIMSMFKINQAVIPSFKYQELKEFYKRRLLKETENVVLSKM
ncbi:MAG: DUF3857 domain-containing protein [bacterium]